MMLVVNDAGGGCYLLVPKSESGDLCMKYTIVANPHMCNLSHLGKYIKSETVS